MSSGLTASQRTLLRQALDRRFEVVREEIREELLRSDDEQYVKIAGQVHDTDLVTDVDLAVIDLHVKEIRDIEAALIRIHSGSYGVCLDCEGDISYERLKAYPTAKRCLSCQRAYERDPTGKHPPTL